jgi:hypothetical protein
MGSDSLAVYLVLIGELRWIPDPTTYNNLFSGWDVHPNDYLVNNMPMGVPFTSGAVLATSPGGAGTPIYVVTNGQKLWIPSQAVFTQFHFNSPAVVTVPDIIINFIPQGLNIG